MAILEIKLRDYQIDIFNKIVSSINDGYKNILVVLPCRSGKTPLATYITKLIKSQGGKVLFNVHRKILLNQTSKTFTKYGIHHGMLSPNYKQTTDTVQIGTIQTVYNRIKKISYPNVIISDEAHRDKAKSREYILRYFENSIRIGLTATPIRLSGESLRDIYDVMIVGPSVEELINRKFLCEFKLYCPPSQINTQNIKTLGGDFNNRELAKETNTKIVTGDAIKHYKKILQNKQTVIFCVDIEHAESTAREYSNAGIPALFLHSKLKTKEQDEIVEKFVNKEIKVLTNVDMITEGYDCPGIDAVQILRKTLSLALHIQICTRGMTPAPGKTECFILDHVGNTEEHGPVDHDFKWSLDKGKKKLQTMDDLKEGEVLIKVCKECWFTYSAHIQACPCCGSNAVRPPSKIKTIDEELLLTRTINNTVRQLVGENKTQGLSVTTLYKRLEIFKANNIPKTSKHYIKIEKRYDTLKAKNMEEILRVAGKWDYTIHWVVNRYITCNRMVNSGNAYSLLQAVCKEHNINLRRK